MINKNNISNRVNNQSGVSLYIAIVIMVVILSIVFGVTTILLGQIAVIKGIESSVVAFYAAESGIEQVLVSRLDPSALDGSSGSLSNNATYEIEVDGSCAATNFCIQSLGKYRDARRTIQVTY